MSPVELLAFESRFQRKPFGTKMSAVRDELGMTVTAYARERSEKWLELYREACIDEARRRGALPRAT